MTEDTYSGWSLFDKVQLICRQERGWKDGKYQLLPTMQGYVVDPQNKKMRENAMHWATWKQTIKQDDGTYAYETISPIVYEFDNSGFTLTLLESANGSSQGGKLSFWNCSISKDGVSWKIGISSDLLLELLKESTFINGVCQQELFFARRAGQVGMLHKSCEAYKKAQADMQKKAAVKSAKKTSKWQQGHNYVTLTTDDVYLTTLYRWLEPIYEERSSHWGRTYKVFVGYRKLLTPKLVHCIVNTDTEKSKLSEYLSDDTRWLSFTDKLPARMQGDYELEVDMNLEEVHQFIIKRFRDRTSKRHEDIMDSINRNLTYNNYDDEYAGLTPHREDYDVPEDIKRMIKEMKLRYEE